MKEEDRSETSLLHMHECSHLKLVINIRGRAYAISILERINITLKATVTNKVIKQKINPPEELKVSLCHGIWHSTIYLQCLSGRVHHSTDVKSVNVNMYENLDLKKWNFSFKKVFIRERIPSISWRVPNFLFI